MLKRFYLLLLSASFIFSNGAFANVPADANLFIITVDATEADETAAGSFTISSSNDNYQYYWEEVGNEAANNSGGALHATTAMHVINFGASGIYKIGIDPINVPSGINNFANYAHASANDDDKVLTVEQWGTTPWSTVTSMFEGTSQFTGIFAADTPDLGRVTSLNKMFTNAVAIVDTAGMGGWNTSTILSLYRVFDGAVQVNPDTSGWDTSKVINMYGLFNSARLATFKNCLSTVARNIEALLLQQSNLLTETVNTIIASISTCRQRLRPNRSYARFSRKPVDKWRPQKSAKTATASSSMTA